MPVVLRQYVCVSLGTDAYISLLTRVEGWSAFYTYIDVIFSEISMKVPVYTVRLLLWRETPLANLNQLIN